MKPNLNRIIEDNLDKAKFQSKLQPSLPKNTGWLDGYADGGLLSKKVTCSNCGWSWKAVDGGMDPMTCHKCGGMIKMKQGGSYNEFPEGGFIDYNQLIGLPEEKPEPMFPYSQDYTNQQYKTYLDFNSKLGKGYDNYDAYYSSFKPIGKRTVQNEGWVMTNKNNIESNLDGDKNNPPEIKKGQKLEWKKTSSEEKIFPREREMTMGFSKFNSLHPNNPNQYSNGGTYISGKALATQFGQYGAGGWLSKYEDGGPKDEYIAPTMPDLRHPGQGSGYQNIDKTIPLMGSTVPNNPDIVRKIEKEKAANEIALRKQASQVMKKKGDTHFTFPNGDYKPYKDMNFRERSYVEGLALDQDTRINKDEDSVLDFFNPLHLIGSLGKGLAQAPYVAKQTDSYLPYVTGIGNPLLAGRMMGSGSMNPLSSKMWTNEISNKAFLNSLALGIPEAVEKIPSTLKNAGRYLAEETPLNKFFPKKLQPLENNRLGNVSNQLPSPPSEIHIDPVTGAMREVYELQPLVEHAPDVIDLRRQPSFVNSWNESKPIEFKNKSGLTKEEVLKKASAKDKDIVSKMSENEFKETVLKPNGEVVKYGTNNGNLYDIVNESTFIPHEEYIKEFNKNIDDLNNIIASKNKSGVHYKVKELRADATSKDYGNLIFETPHQEIPGTIPRDLKIQFDEFHKNPEKFLIDNDALKKTSDGKWILDNDKSLIFNVKEDAINHAKQHIAEISAEHTKLKPISGESEFLVKINPGKWKGNVEDVVNAHYYKNIPGLNMSHSRGVFSDYVPRKGTGAYDAINEYLKKYDLGRVKPGFNSQSQYSRGLWENAIQKGKAVGYYDDPRTIYGVMKTVVPAVGIGATALNKEKYGGDISISSLNNNWLSKYENGSVVDYLADRNQDFSYSHRKELAKELGIENYRGTAKQNLQMLSMLKQASQPKEETDEVEQTDVQPSAVNPFVSFDNYSFNKPDNIAPSNYSLSTNKKIPSVAELKSKLVNRTKQQEAPVKKAVPVNNVKIPEYNPFNFINNPQSVLPTNNNVRGSKIPEYDPFGFIKALPPRGPAPANEKVNEKHWYDEVKDLGKYFYDIDNQSEGIKSEDYSNKMQQGVNFLNRKFGKHNEQVSELVIPTKPVVSKNSKVIPVDTPAVVRGKTIHLMNDLEYAPEIVDLNKINVGVRNRGDVNPIDTKGIIFGPVGVGDNSKDFKPSDTIKLKSSQGYVGVDKSGKIKIGFGDDFKNDIYQISPFRIIKDVTGFSKQKDDYELADASQAKKGYFSPVLKTLKGDKEATGTLVQSNKNKNTYGDITGGHVIFTSPDFSKKIVVSGSVVDIENALENFKKENDLKTVNFVQVDNGTYNKNVIPKKGKLTKKDLKILDNFNEYGNNFIYMKKQGGQLNWLDKYN